MTSKNLPDPKWLGDIDATMRPWMPRADQMAKLKLVTAMNAPGMRIASVAVLAPGDIDVSRLMTPDLTNAVWTIERDCLDEFLADPALRGYLRHRVPVVVCFEHADDHQRCWSIFNTRAAGAGATG